MKCQHEARELSIAYCLHVLSWQALENDDACATLIVKLLLWQCLDFMGQAQKRGEPSFCVH